MRGISRRLGTVAVTLSLLSGSLLPFIAPPAVADSDGACGPVLVLAHSVEHFEAPLPAETDHCVLCHFWNAIATGSVSTGAPLAPPDGTAAETLVLPTGRTARGALGEASPRGPPARA